MSNTTSQQAWQQGLTEPACEWSRDAFTLNLLSVKAFEAV